MPRFDKSKRYVNKKGRQFGKGVWVDDDGIIIYPGQSRMGKGSRETRTVTQYNSDGTKTVYPWEEWAKKSQREHEIRVLQNDRKYVIPYIPEKRMTITIDENSPTRHAAGATFSENMLDSIAVNAKKAGLPFSTAIGLVAQESTFGQGERGAGKSMLPWNRVLNTSSGDVKDKAKAISYGGYYSPTLLISNWKQRQEGPFYDYFYNEKGTLLEKPKDSHFYDEDINNARREANNYHLKDESSLEHGFRKYREAPDKYNPGNPNYQKEVAEKTSELVNYSPEIRAYMKENHLHAGGGSLEQPLQWNELSLSEKAEIIKKAVDAGMHSLRDIKSAYNSQIEGDSYACGGHLFKKGGKEDSASPLAQRALQYFIGKGLTQEQAAGLVGNLQRESGLNYKAINPNGGAVGIAQWLGSRKKKLFEKYGKNPTFDDQLDYVWYELNTTHKNGLRKLKESKTVDDAALNAFGYYEFSGGPAAAIKSMNSHGMNTKWKNGDGNKAMARGIMNGRKLLGQVPYASTEAVGVPQVTAIPQFLFESNPTDYGTPVDYSTPVRPVTEDAMPTPVEEKQNGWGLFNFIQSLGTPQQTVKPLTSNQPTAGDSSPYVVGVPSASSMLDVSWFAGGGPLEGSYSDWKKAIAEHKDIHPDEDNTYDYEGYYNQYPVQAWAMLADDPEAHFVDEFKTVYHPTFSNQSRYSGIVDARFNPEGIIGGNWSEDGKRYTLSEDQARHRWDVGRTMEYMGDAEDNGVAGFYPDGRHWTTADGDMWGGTLPAVTVTPRKKARGGYLFDDGGGFQNIAQSDNTFVVAPIDAVGIYPELSEEAALKRANRVYSNYSEAKDSPLSPLQEAVYNVARYAKDHVWEGIPSGVSNCTLTATQWVNPTMPIKNASSIVNSPSKYGYTRISAEDAVPGNLLIARNPKDGRYHTMLINGFAKADGVYNFNGTDYPYRVGEPLLTYSTGGHDESALRKNIPLSVYTPNSDGKTEKYYYRYNYPNEVFLPEVQVVAKRHK